MLSFSWPVARSCGEPVPALPDCGPKKQYAGAEFPRRRRQKRKDGEAYFFIFSFTGSFTFSTVSNSTLTSLPFTFSTRRI